MKKKIDVARAWRDEDYFLSLTEEERASLGVHPAGAVALHDETLQSITGGCCEPPSYAYCGSAYCTPCPPRFCY